MKKEILLFTVTMLICTFVSNAAPSPSVTDANITGHVIEADNGEHLPGCLVKIKNTDIATVTDASGHYLFRDLRPGNYTIEISLMGYETQNKCNPQNEMLG